MRNNKRRASASAEDKRIKEELVRKERQEEHEARIAEEHKIIAREAKRVGKEGTKKLRRQIKEARDAEKVADRKRHRIKDASGAGKAKAPKLTLGSSKMLDKSIRQAMKIPRPPKNPYAALMEPMVVVPDVSEDKVVIADAGSIVRLMDQTTLYRDRVSPITRRGDELLVQYGSPGKLKLGWLTNKQPDTIMKPSTGPTFLVTTRSEDGLAAWEQLRLKVARTRKSDPTNWIAPWLVTHGPKVPPRLLREVTRYFGGKPVKNEPFDARCARLFQLILNVELDMVTAKNSKSSKKTKNKKQNSKDVDVEAVSTKTSKKGKGKKSKKEKPEPAPEKKSKKTKTKKVSRVSEDRIGRDKDDYIIKRLIQENPRREGTHKYKIWSRLKKGMTVGEFAAKGDGCSRTEVKHFLKAGWIKLLRPKAA